MKKVIFLCLIVFLQSCQQKIKESKFSTEDSIKIIDEILSYRAKQDSFFRYSPESPFKRDTTIKYEGLKFFKPDLRFYFMSKLYRYADPETVIVLGTKGEERKQLKYGYFKLIFGNKEHRINVYKFTYHDTNRYRMYKDNLSFWFRDRTTGKETYDIGRYVEIGNENPDVDFIYTIDLNKAFNPYCAYSHLYSCAIPRDEDYLDFEVRAGEKKYYKD